MKYKAPNGQKYLAYQEAGIDFLLNRDKALLADEMGLGKTIQVLGYANELGFPNVVVVCPAHLRYNWIREAEKWLFSPGHMEAVVKTQPTSRRTNFTAVSYDLLHKDKVWASIANRHIDLLVMDEAHYLANPKTKRTRACLNLAKRAGKVVALTGTPVPAKPIQLQPMLSMLAPEIFGTDYWKFAIKYANARQTMWGWDVNGASHLAELHNLLSGSVMLRRLKKDVLPELPSKMRQVLALSPNLKVKGLIEKEPSYVSSLEKVEVDFTEMSATRRDMAIEKAPVVADHVKMVLHDVDKVVVFAHHKAVIREIREAVEEFNPAVVVGDTAARKRQDEVDRFQSDPACRVFIGNLHAAGTGITLTSAQTVIFAEQDWNPGTMEQCEDRCHRIGQTLPVHIQYLVWEGSLDANLAHILAAKENICAKILGGKNA